MRKWCWGVVCVLSGIVSHGATAACTQNTSDGSSFYIAEVSGIDPPEFDPDSIAIGGVIYENTGTSTFTNIAGTRPGVTCNPAMEIYGTGEGVPDKNIYPTSIPNIGIRLVYKSGASLPLRTGNVGQVTLYWDPAYVFKLQFVKTGEITAGGTLTGAYAHFRAGSASGDQLVEFRFAKPVKIRPRIPTCKVATPVVTVPMETMVKSQFTGVGSTSNASVFDISLSCSGGNAGTATNAYVTLTDATDAKNTSTTLSLSNDSTASGVGLQVLNAGKPLGFGPDSAAVGNTNQWFAGTVKQGQAALKIPLSARYVQTGPTVTEGVANARATFTLSYQ